MTAPILLGIAMLIAYIPFAYDIYKKIQDEIKKRSEPKQKWHEE